MSKIKDWLIRQQQKEYEIYIGYEDRLFENKIQMIKENDINKKKDDVEKVSTVRNFVVTNIPFNNANYNSSLVEA